FVRYARDGGPITTSPIAARYAVAAGYLATESLRSGSIPMDVPPVPDHLVEYFRSQVKGGV
ncbi:MAG: gfo/Idh/MocA family oxidoreductase, partial [Thermoleophilia bacterium]|nr:gfo/Idh/MocA family oxidoreductase [Thermoleophilia bacterium]